MKYESVTIGNESKSLSEWAASSGIAYNALRKRLSRGWSEERLLSAPPKQIYSNEYSIGKVSKTLVEWAKVAGIAPEVSAQRLRDGWPVADAFFVPVVEGNVKHGHALGGATKEYAAWCSMKSRCLNPNVEGYEYYGGRGIRVCLQWLVSFEAFLSDVGLAPTPLHSIDRIDNEGHYEPGNVRWALPVVQANNKRGTKTLTVRGTTKPLMEWARLAGLSRETLRRRLETLSAEEAVSRPVRTR